MPLRHKKKSQSRFVSEILKDIIRVQNEIKNDKPDSFQSEKILFPFHDWQSNIDNEHRIISNYTDYQKINDFYIALRSRNCYLLQNQVNNDILNILNKDCVNQATIAHTEINWRKFHKLDLVLLIPAVILGSLFITFVCDASLLGTDYFLLFIIRGIGGFFIIRIILKGIQGTIINNYALPSVLRSFSFWFFAFAIVGVPTVSILYQYTNYIISL
jgi:hypothetical protein